MSKPNFTNLIDFNKKNVFNYVNIIIIYVYIQSYIKIAYIKENVLMSITKY